MAQALYDEHPLDSYLRESGEALERVPGAFTDSSDDEVEEIVVNSHVDSHWRRSSLSSVAETLREWSSTFRQFLPSPNHDFAERFKYDLISSNLLSTSVTSTPVTSHIRTRPPSPEPSVPGELPIPKQDVVEEKSKQELKSLSSAFVFVGLAALLNQYRVAAALAMFTSFTFAKSTEITSANKNYIPQMFEALKYLKAAGSAWDAVVNDAITILEQEERSPYPASSSAAPPSPSSALRIALHSTLLTTQNQCDNVRPLLAALAAPLELSQLAEMYAPSSPVKLSFSLQSRTSTPRRERVSLSENAIASLTSTPRTPSSDKRRTWNGGSVSLANMNARTSSVLRKRDRRRSDLSALLDPHRSPSSISTAPTSPSPTSPPLTQVLEAEEDEEENATIDELDASKDNFGTAALFLRRKQRTRGVDALGLSSSRSVPTLRNPFLSPPMSQLSFSSSRFTSMQTARHPLSLSALHHALQGALSARRYACSHLLALRFDEDSEDETYWENVRSVIGLLTSTLEDGAARLSEAVEAAERMMSQEAQPSPSPSPCPTPGSESLNSPFAIPLGASERTNRSSTQFRLSLSVPAEKQIPLSPMGIQSFAPAPSGLSRFATHMDAITSALDDAREHMQHCVATLREQELSASPTSPDEGTEEQAIFESYERLRRELGLALRECERGKVALNDVFEARRRRCRPFVEQDAEEEEGAHHETSSGGSAESDEKHDSGPFTPNEGSPVLPSLPSLDSILAAHYDASASHADAGRDDVTEHLLASSSTSHLPPPGIEQVFEAEVVESDRYTRERPKLSREERIKLMKAKRESVVGRSPGVVGSDDAARRARMGWGPGTEVVEELKDVIWKVGERRRKMLISSSRSDPVSPVSPRTETPASSPHPERLIPSDTRPPAL